jgi:hypothetical protein
MQTHDLDVEHSDLRGDNCRNIASHSQSTNRLSKSLNNDRLLTI